MVAKRRMIYRSLALQTHDCALLLAYLKSRWLEKETKPVIASERSGWCVDNFRKNQGKQEQMMRMIHSMDAHLLIVCVEKLERRETTKNAFHDASVGYGGGADHVSHTIQDMLHCESMQGRNGKMV